jgi:predicted Zn-dependent protease
MESTEESVFDQAMSRYESGIDANELIKDFEAITASAPNHSAGWTCLAWLQLLCNENELALRSARRAVKLNKQDPQSRINLCLALLETNSKGVRDHIEFLQRVLVAVPDLEKELKNSIEDGLKRKPDWQALKKIKSWLDF